MGSLEGIKVLEFAGLGPAPIAGMMLADMGAEVLLVERIPSKSNLTSIDTSSFGKAALFRRGKKSITLDLKLSESVDTVLSLIESIHVLIEGFRPGVMEGLGLGPKPCLSRNPKLVYGRLTGWGQTGPLAPRAGHDLNYLALSGMLDYCGLPDQKPYPPPTVVGDIAGGTHTLCIGVLSALLHVQRGGPGQIIDAAICDGSTYMQTLLQTTEASMGYSVKNPDHFFSGRCHWCNTYPCADGKYMVVQAIEPKFYQILLQKLNLNHHEAFAYPFDRDSWPSAIKIMTELFVTQPQDHWIKVFEDSDACVTPVLTRAEAAAPPPIHRTQKA